MHVLLDKERGLRVPGERVSHVFVVQAASYPVLPDLNAKAEILFKAVEFFALIGIERPMIAVLFAMERSLTRLSRRSTPPGSS
jgi:hypothetical protein